MSFEEQVMSEYSSFDQMDNNAGALPDCPGSLIILLRNKKICDALFPNVQFHYLHGLPIIYIGITNIGILNRYMEHFHGTARSSTLRKSIGALFHWHDYRVIMVGNRYRFDDSHENELTEWMKENLLFLYKSALPDVDLNICKQYLIQELNPPLNIGMNHNQINSQFREDLTMMRG